MTRRTFAKSLRAKVSNEEIVEIGGEKFRKGDRIIGYEPPMQRELVEDPYGLGIKAMVAPGQTINWRKEFKRQKGREPEAGDFKGKTT